MTPLRQGFAGQGDVNKAVFLSYASQDAEAARRICEALRAGGVEVWFDADGGLEHGDEWDAKIRRQVKECVLFIPIISANTQARHEGYFRIEWELAAQRALGIASGVPFILPVVIDDTREPDALVPDRFRTVQWTKLRGGEVPAEVQQRFLKLWSHRTGVIKHEAARAGGASETLTAGEAVGKPGAKTYALLAAAVAVIVAAVAWWQFRSVPTANVTEKPGVPVKTVSETEQLVKQARDLIYDPDSARNEFGLAENLLKRATDLAPTSGEAWGASALLNHYFYSRAYDRDRQRLARSLAEAEKALRLSPHNTDALLALGLHRQVMGENERAKNFLDQAHASDPQNYKVILAQSQQIIGWVERAHFLLDAATHVMHPAELYYYAANDFDYAGRWEEAREANNRAIAAQPFWRAFVQGAVIEYTSTADSAKMDAWLDRVPELKRDEPRVALMRYLAATLRRDGAAAARVLNALAADYLEDNFYTGPKSYLLAQAYELAGQPALALEQWQLAERVVREKLAANPNDRFMRPQLAVLLAAQHRTDEARQTAAACAADERVKGNWIAREILAEAYVRLSEPDRAITLLSDERSSTQSRGDVSAASLAAEPRWDALRARPGYPQLLEQLRRNENGGAGSPSSSATRSDEKSVAVLAFANLSDDKANEYFSDGISEELLNVLAKVPGLKVTARTSSFYFKGKEVPIPEIAKQLGVAYVVEGSVRKAGDKVRITAQLIKAADGFHVWSDTFTRDLKDIFAVQDEIAGLIAKNLSLRLGVDRSTSGRATVPEAYELYLQGRAAWNLRTKEGYARAESLLSRAIDLDPGFARAHTALADVWSIAGYENETGGGTYGWRNSPTVAKIAAKADQALALDPQCAEAYTSQALALEFRWELAAAERSYRRAIELNPNYSTARHWFGMLLWVQGEMDEALRQMQMAAASDPLSHRILDTHARMLNLLGRPDEALAVADRALALQPHAIQAATQKALALVLLGRAAEAVALIEKALAWGGSIEQRTNALVVLHMAGADAVMRRVIGSTADMPASQFKFASLIALGRSDEALAGLRPADLHENQLISMALFQFYDPVREDPRFLKAISDVGYMENYRRARAWLTANLPKVKE